MPRKVQKILIRSLSNVRDAGLTTQGQGEVERRDKALKMLKEIKKSIQTTMRLKWTFWDILGHFETFETFWEN